MVILGISNPCEVDEISSTAEGSGVVVPIPTLLFWAVTIAGKAIERTAKKSIFLSIMFSFYTSKECNDNKSALIICNNIVNFEFAPR